MPRNVLIGFCSMPVEESRPPNANQKSIMRLLTLLWQHESRDGRR